MPGWVRFERYHRCGMSRDGTVWSLLALNPTLSPASPLLSCAHSYCNDCRDLDLCRDAVLAAQSPAQGGSGWACRECGQHYHMPSIERRLVAALQQHVREYQLQVGAGCMAAVVVLIVLVVRFCAGGNNSGVDEGGLSMLRCYGHLSS